MSMTRKDYEAVAQSLNLAKRTITTSGLYDAETALALAVAILADRLEDNSNFNRTMFVEACEA